MKDISVSIGSFVPVLARTPALCPTATPSTYVSADADAVTTEGLTEAEIVRVVTGGAQ